jgi:hypothetical protein
MLEIYKWIRHYTKYGNGGVTQSGETINFFVYGRGLETDWDFQIDWWKRYKMFFIGDEMKYSNRGRKLTKNLSKSRLLHSIKMCNSMSESSRYLDVSYNTFKKYCKIYGLWIEEYKNQSGKGISKNKKVVMVYDII